METGLTKWHHNLGWRGRGADKDHRPEINEITEENGANITLQNIFCELLQ
jgi:hypothetical protein